MGKSIGEIYAELSLKTDKLHDGIKKSNREIAKLEQDIDKAVESINAKLAVIGTSLSIGVTAPLTLFGKAALDTFSNFEQSMQNTFSVMGASASEMEALRKKAEDMGATTRFSASQAADALYSLGSAGQTAAQAMNSLDGVLQLAGATGSDLAFTSSTIASTLSQFNLSAEKSGHIADVFSLAISKSQANMTKLSYSMKYVGPVAAGLGVSLETSTAALMRLYNTGFGGEQAGTILRSGLQKLASGTEDVKKKLQELGISYDEVNPKTNDLADIIQRLKDANIDVAKSSELFGEAAAAGMQALIEGGGDAIRTMDGLLQASDGAAKKMQDIQNASFANTKAELSSAFEAVLITLTSNIIPAVDAVAKSITRVLQFVNELPVGVQTTGTAFAALAAAAGPLLLVAVGIKKIKAEMVQLNLVMSANPVLAWGAAVAAAGAIALGIIAQVKKAHEDAMKHAERQLEQAKALASDAAKSGDKGRSIQDLLGKYDSLKGKIHDSKEAQSQFNSVVEQLKQIVPDAQGALRAQGESLEQFVTKARKAARDALELEKVKNERALLLSKQAANEAQKYVAENESKLERSFKIYSQDIHRTNTYESIFEQFKTARLQGDKEKQAAIAELKKIAHFLKKDVGEDGFSFASFEDMFASLGIVISQNNKKLAKDGTSLKEQQALLDEQKQIITEANQLKLKIETGADALAQLDKKEDTQTKNQALETLQKKWEQFKASGIQAVKERKKIEGEAFDENKEYYEFLKNEIKQVAELQNIVDENGNKIKLTSQDLAEFIRLREQFNKLLEKGKGGHKGPKTKEKDTSYQAQIAELDKFYQDKIAKAKEYGQSSLAVEKEYQQKRLALIEQFIKEEDKKKGAGKGIGVETKEATKDSKGSGITLGEELTKTKLMSDAFARYQAQQKELQEALQKTQEEIEKTKALLEGEKGAVSSEEARQAKQYLQQLQEEANKLEIELQMSKYSLSQIDDTLKGLEKVGKSDLKLRLIDIEQERKNAHEALEQARKIGKIKDDDELDRYKKLADKKADFDEKSAKVAAAQGIMGGVESIANSITKVVADAIEKGGVDGFTALKASGEIIGQIGSMISNPIAQAILGGVSVAVGIASSIMQAVKNTNDAITKKAREDAQKFNEEIKKGQEESIRNAATLTGEVVKNIAKLRAGGRLGGDTIFDSHSLEIEKGRIDDVLNKMKDLKTEATYTYQQKRTRTVQHALDPLGWFKKEETYYTTETAQYTVAQVMEKYNDAMRAGDYELAKKWKDFAQKAIDKGLKDAGITRENADPLSNYIGNLDSALAGYVKTRNMKDFKKALRDQLYEALVNKAVKNAISQRIAKVFDSVEKGNITYEEGLKQIETIGKEAGEIFDDMNKRFGFSAEAARKEWEAVGSAITSALTNALGDAAYNADWTSFKKSFASEMKKAIIKAAIENAGIKQKVDAIIQDIIKDGKITGDEVTGTIDKLKNLYDNLEGNMAELSKITKALEGGVELKSKTSGSIIQQLSGTDRDVLLEAIREGFKTINQVIDLKETTIQHLTATQIVINSVTYNSYNSVINITATEQTDLRAVLAELVKEALAG